MHLYVMCVCLCGYAGMCVRVRRVLFSVCINFATHLRFLICAYEYTGHTMKNLSLLIIIFASLEDWIYALVDTTRLSIKWEMSLRKFGLERTITTQGKFCE